MGKKLVKNSQKSLINENNAKEKFKLNFVTHFSIINLKDEAFSHFSPFGNFNYSNKLDFKGKVIQIFLY